MDKYDRQVFHFSVSLLSVSLLSVSLLSGSQGLCSWDRLIGTVFSFVTFNFVSAISQLCSNIFNPFHEACLVFSIVTCELWIFCDIRTTFWHSTTRVHTDCNSSERVRIERSPFMCAPYLEKSKPKF